MEAGGGAEAGREEPVSQPALDVVFHPDLTDEQRAVALEVVADLFEAAGGRGGLKIESIEDLRTT